MDHLMHAPCGAGVAAPIKDEASTAGTVRGLGDQQNSSSFDSATSVADAKQVETLRARAALAGYELAHLEDGTFLATRWGLFRVLEHPAAVEKFLRQIGAPA